MRRRGAEEANGRADGEDGDGGSGRVVSGAATARDGSLHFRDDCASLATQCLSTPFPTLTCLASSGSTPGGRASGI